MEFCRDREIKVMLISQVKARSIFDFDEAQKFVAAKLMIKNINHLSADHDK